MFLCHLGRLQMGFSMFMSLLYGGPGLDTVLQMWPHKCRVRGKGSPLLIYQPFCLMQPRVLLASLAAKICGWLMFSLVSTRSLKSFCYKLEVYPIFKIPVVNVDWVPNKHWFYLLRNYVDLRWFTGFTSKNRQHLFCIEKTVSPFFYPYNYP